MKAKRLFTLILLSVLCFALAITLASCKKDECNHRWGDWEDVEGEEPTCEDGGRQYRVCRIDASHVEYRDVPAGHDFGGEYGKSGGAHWQYCQKEGCDAREINDHVSGGEPTYETAEYCSVCGYEMAPALEKPHELTNKKVIFIGNSHTFYGKAVNEKTPDEGRMSKRQNDKGTFYKIATACGAKNLNVTNWTYGNHGLQDLFAGAFEDEAIREAGCQANRACGNGYDHFADLTDKYYDYVIIQQGSTHHATLFTQLETTMAVFRKANPNVKFFYIVQARAHNDNYAWLTDVKRIESELGMTIIDWGDLVYDVYTGATAVPGATLPYNKDSFVIAQNDKDGYHPNLLAGYITSLMTYCAITGESAVGKNYKVFEDSTIESFISAKYKVRPTNFDQIFDSEADMRGLQALIDKYLEEKYYRNYTAENH